MTTLRRQGVFGYNLPPQVGNVVQPAQFNVVGMVGRFSRGINQTIEINQVSEIDVKLGDYKEGYLGRYVLESIFSNLNGNSCKVIVRPFISSTATQSYKNVKDANNNNTIKIKACYKKISDKSLDGNKTGFTIEKGNRFTTKTTASASTGDTEISLQSVIGVRTGDVLEIGTQFVKVLSIDEGNKKCTITALSSNVAVDTIVNVKGFKVVTYRKNRNGIPIKLNIPENDIWITMEPENTEFYCEKVFENHPYLDIEDLNSSSTLYSSFPEDTTEINFLENGSDGGSPTIADWNNLLTSFDNANVRFLFNAESSEKEVNVFGENYCQSRLDTPIWIYHIPKNLSKEQLISLGNFYQRSNQVQGIIVSSYRKVFDPIGVGANPSLSIPLCGAIAGLFVRSFYSFGFHRVPAGDDLPILGFLAEKTTEDEFSEDDRTDICQAGVNIVQYIQGRGLINRSAYTPSTNTGALFINYLVMQNFIKISSVESLYKVENRPNKLSLLKTYADSIKDFGKKLYDGSFPFGIDSNGAFGQFFKADGSVSTFEDVFIVQADQFNNTNSQLAIGEGNIFVRFFPPAPLTSLAIGVGVVIPL